MKDKEHMKKKVNVKLSLNDWTIVLATLFAGMIRLDKEDKLTLVEIYDKIKFQSKVNSL